LALVFRSFHVLRSLTPCIPGIRQVFTDNDQMILQEGLKKTQGALYFIKQVGFLISLIQNGGVSMKRFTVPRMAHCSEGCTI